MSNFVSRVQELKFLRGLGFKVSVFGVQVEKTGRGQNFQMVHKTTLVFKIPKNLKLAYG